MINKKLKIKFSENDVLGMCYVMLFQEHIDMNCCGDHEKIRIKRKSLQDIESFVRTKLFNEN